MDFITNFFTTNNGEIEIKKIIGTLVVATIAAIASITVSLITAILNSTRTKKTTYINTITSNRIKWIQDIRGLVDDFLRKTQTGYHTAIYFDVKERNQYFDELASVRNNIFLKLNYKGYIDEKIINTVNEIYTRIELIYEIDALLKEKDVKEKMNYIFKNFHKEIFEKMLSAMEVNGNKKDEIIKCLEAGNDIPEELSGAINKQISSFNEKYRCAPRKIAKEIQNYHNQLVMLVQIYLKLEWNRVKDESRSKFGSYNEKKYKKIVDEMIQSYNLSLYDYSHNKLPDYLR